MPSPLINMSVSPIGFLPLAKAASWQDERLSGRFQSTGEISAASGNERGFINEPSDPVTLALSTLGIALVAILAGYVPARRATGIDPTKALRFE